MKTLKIYVHGNCQAPTLSALLAEACGPSVEVVSRQVFSIDLETEFEAYRDDVTSADVILAQPVTENYRGTEVFSTPWIKANARPDAKVLTFPVVYHRGQLPQCFPMSSWHDDRLAYHDAHALDYFLDGKEADRFVDDTSAADFLPPGLVAAELSQTTLELMRREHTSSAEIRASSAIAARLLVDQPLHTVNHPDRALMCDLADQVLAIMGRPERSRVEGLDMLDRFIMPPYLSTLVALGHGGQGVRMDEVRCEGRTESRRDFFREVFAVYRSIGTEALSAGLAVDREVRAYLERYRRARAVETTYDERPFIDALYRVFNNRLPTTDEVFHHLQTLRHLGPAVLIAAFANSAEFDQAGGINGLRARNGVGAAQADGPLPAPILPPRRPDEAPQGEAKSGAAGSSGWKRARKNLLSMVGK